MQTIAVKKPSKTAIPQAKPPQTATKTQNLSEETGLYYYGARYLDPKTSRWLSGDPALGEYVPSAPINDEAKKRNGSLPGQGGVFNYVNLHVYHYAGNNPVKYVDPDGENINVAVTFLKNSSNLASETKSSLTLGLIQGIYNAERKRMRLTDFIGLGETIGRGQVSRAAYDDVMQILGNDLTVYCERLNINFSGDFKKDMANSDIEDFIVAGYLSIQINRSQRNGRSSEDAIKYGIGLYHGARETIVNAQNESREVTSFSGVETILMNGNRKQKDIINYINEVYDSR
jgi:RHS repeat-associated protein